MNKMDLIEHVAGEMEMSRAAANRAVDTIIEGITKALKKGEEVRITGFGTISDLRPLRQHLSREDQPRVLSGGRASVQCSSG